MGIEGRYDFPGIKKAGAAGLKVALASTTWGAALLKIPVLGFIVNDLLELFVNWAANQGLVVMNLGAIVVSGELDQKAFDQAIDEGLKELELGRDKISPEQGAKIDEAVKNAARRFIPFNPTN